MSRVGFSAHAAMRVTRLYRARRFYRPETPQTTADTSRARTSFPAMPVRLSRARWLGIRHDHRLRPRISGTNFTTSNERYNLHRWRWVVVPYPRLNCFLTSKNDTSPVPWIRCARSLVPALPPARFLRSVVVGFRSGNELVAQLYLRAAALPGWINRLDSTRGPVLDFVGQWRPAVFGRGSDRDGWGNRMSEQRGHDFKAASFGGRADRTPTEGTPGQWSRLGMRGSVPADGAGAERSLRGPEDVGRSQRVK